MSETTSTEKGKKTDGKPAKGASKKPATKVKQPKEKKERASGPALCVFAFRLPRTDRDRIHAIAGSARASKFVIAATMAAVEGDVEAFKKVVASRATK
jgi:hypothetical protein